MKEDKIVKELIKQLYQKIGNKVYLRDLEKMLEEKLKDLSPKYRETLIYLIRDLRNK